MRKTFWRMIMLAMVIVSCFSISLDVEAAQPKTSITSMTEGSNYVTVKWKKPSKKVSGYQVQRATNSKFTKNKKTYTVSSYETTKKKLTSLSGNKKYYVRVRTYKNVKVNGKTKKQYSKWSEVKSVKTLSASYKNMFYNDGWHSSGKYQVKLTDSGKLYYRVNGGKSYLISNNVGGATLYKSKVYYMYHWDDDYSMTEFYCFNLKTKFDMWIADAYENEMNEYIGYYNGNIYYGGHLGSIEYDIFRVDVSEGIRYRIWELQELDGPAQMRGKYIYVTGYRGDISSVELLVYNAATDRIRTISNRFMSGRIKDGKLYYCVYNGYSNNKESFTFYRASLGGTNKKKLSTLKISKYMSSIPYVGKTYALFACIDDNEKTYYVKYTYSTNKIKYISEKEFDKQRKNIDDNQLG